MKYKTINKNYKWNYNDDLLYSLLKQRGVEDPEILMKLDESFVHSGLLLENMNEGLDLFKKHIDKNSVIHIIIDCDLDGYSSASVLYRYIKKCGFKNKITFSTNPGKEHGIKLKELDKHEFDLLIVPDAGSGDIKECKNLKNRGKDILILDHHNFNKANPYATLINCQDGKYPNNTLSGVGVVYKFIKEFDKKYGYNNADCFLDLVSIGMVADDMDLRNPETRYLVLKGIEKINKRDNINSFINELLIKNRLDNINILDISWKIAPQMNGVVRVGTLDEKMLVFRALIGDKQDFEYQPKKKKKSDPKPQKEIHSLQKYMAREIGNIKARQDRQVKKGFEEINKKIEENNLNLNKMIIVDGTSILEKTFTGLVANKLADSYKRPVLVLRERNSKTYGGSGRNYKLSSLENMQGFLRETSLFNSVDGHDNAFGFNLNKDNLDDLIKEINIRLKDMTIEDCHWVDYEIPVGRLKPKNIIQIGKWKNVWGNTLKEPQFAITDIHVSPQDVQLIGSKRNVIKITKALGDKTISFVKFFANEDIYNEMIMKSKKGLGKKSPKKLKFDIIGKFDVNEYEGKDYPQITIVDFNVSEGRKIQF